MPKTKSELFDTELQAVAEIFKALSHPARLAILNYIGETGVCITGDISDELPLGRTTINQHLGELKKLDLIQGEVSGTKVNYCLNLKTLARAKEVMDTFINKLNCC
jgi:ArsR family transcriptional regulator